MTEPSAAIAEMARLWLTDVLRLSDEITRLEAHNAQLRVKLRETLALLRDQEALELSVF